MADVTTVDGRVARGERNREAIVESLVACYEDGVLRPSAAEVARRAGVSARSVHNHFDDMETLRAEVARRQWERHGTLAQPVSADGPLAERIARVVERRRVLFETLTPVRRAALLSVHDSPTIADNLARFDRAMRANAATTFAPELAGAPDHVLDALDALLSWDTWNRVRGAQRCSPERAARIVTTAVEALLSKGDRR